MSNLGKLLGNKEFKQWLHTNKQQLAERWGRYVEIRQNEFVSFTRSKEQQINYLAIECLEACLLVEPSEQQIKQVEKMLKKDSKLKTYFQ